mmetsp:Transcript_9509/g.15563  ORF Transcript_9509/g.15563 Transcript_9509/m.15563 type:complete len:222 (+) Transcript_9509:115-780(+)
MLWKICQAVRCTSRLRHTRLLTTLSNGSVHSDYETLYKSARSKAYFRAVGVSSLGACGLLTALGVAVLDPVELYEHFWRTPHEKKASPEILTVPQRVGYFAVLSTVGAALFFGGWSHAVKRIKQLSVDSSRRKIRIITSDLMGREKSRDLSIADVVLPKSVLNASKGSTLRWYNFQAKGDRLWYNIEGDGNFIDRDLLVNVLKGSAPPLRPSVQKTKLLFQ